MTFKTGDKGQTRDGDGYEIVAVLDPEKVEPHNELVVMCNGNISFRYSDGTAALCACSADLLPPKQKIEGWVAIYNDRFSSVWSTKEIALKNAGDSDNISAVVHVTIPYEIGEGLE